MSGKMKWENIGKKGALVFIIVALLITVAPLIMSKQVKASSNTIYVPDNHTKIQWGVDNATEGDTIIVDASGGPYYERVVVDKQLNLTGIGMPVVDAEGCGDVIRITADSCVFAGFEVVNSEWASGIKVESNGNVIKNNIISGNCYGIHLLDSSNNEITRNNVSNHISKTEISAAIGPEGGIIEVTNPNSSLYGLKVEIQAGALDVTTNIKLRPISQEELEKEMKVCYTGSAYDFSKPLNVSENGSILVAQIFPDVDNNTKPDLILVDIGSVEGEFVVGSSFVERGLAQASCLPVPGITQGGTLTFLYQGETIFLTGRVVDSMGSPLGGSIVTSLQSGGVKAISQANGEYALNAALYGPGQQTINFVACNHILNLLGTNNIPINPLSIPTDKVVSVDDTEVSKTKEEVEAAMGTRVLDGICEEPLGKALMDAFFELCKGVAIDATDKCVSNLLTESEYSFHPNEMDLHVGESGTFEVDCSSIVGSDVPIPSCPHGAIWPLICDVNIKLNMEIPVGTVTTLTIDASVEDENIATIVGTENPTLEDRTLRVVVRGEDEGTTNLTGKIKKCSASYSIKFSSGVDETICANAKSAPNIDCGNTSIRPATINVDCFPEDHFGDAEYEDSNQDWDGDGELDGTDKNGDTYGDKQITWHAGRSHVVCEDFSINSEDYTLTIEPGAEVTFVKGATLEAEDDGGVLIAEGTEDQKIVFREFGGGNCSPTYSYSPPSLWIKSDGSRFSYCSVERGVEVHSAYNDLEISHCDFTHPDIAIECGSPTITENTCCDGGWVDIHDDNAQITGNTFEGSDIVLRTGVDSPCITGNSFNGSSISVDGGSPTITENSFTGSYIDVSFSGSPTITENSFLNGVISVDGGSPTITENSFNGGGIVVGGGSPTIIGNTISGGCISGHDGSPIITGNTISGSGYSGIEVPDDSIVTGNTISGSGSNGIMVYGDSIVTENSISCSGSNGIMVYGGSIYGGSPTITGNNMRRSRPMRVLGMPTWDDFRSRCRICKDRKC
jgi:parallel beta-helix repeat protein